MHCLAIRGGDYIGPPLPSASPAAPADAASTVTASDAYIPLPARSGSATSMQQKNITHAFMVAQLFRRFNLLADAFRSRVTLYPRRWLASPPNQSTAEVLRRKSKIPRLAATAARS